MAGNVTWQNGLWARVKALVVGDAADPSAAVATALETAASASTSGPLACSPAPVSEAPRASYVCHVPSTSDEAYSQLFPRGGPQPKDSIKILYGRDGESPVAFVYIDGDPQNYLKFGLFPNGELMTANCQAAGKDSFCQTMAMDRKNLAPWTDVVRIGPRIGTPNLSCEVPQLAQDAAVLSAPVTGVDPVKAVATWIKYLRPGFSDEQRAQVARQIVTVWQDRHIENPFWNSIAYGEVQTLEGLLGAAVADFAYHPDREVVEMARSGVGEVLACMNRDHCRLRDTAKRAVEVPVRGTFSKDLPFDRPLTGFYPPPLQTTDKLGGLMSEAGERLTRSAVDTALRRAAPIVASQEGLRLVCGEMANQGNPYMSLDILAGCMENPVFRAQFMSAAVSDPRYLDVFRGVASDLIEQGLYLPEPNARLRKAYCKDGPDGGAGSE